MADVAQLGIHVTERGTDKATDGLTKLAGAAARAEASTEGLAAANRGATGAAASAAAAYAKEGTAAQSASRQIEMMNRAANSNVAGHRGNIANLAAQVQDTIISAQGGMAALTIGFQQGTQAAMVLASMDKPIQGLAQAFAMVLSPVSLVTIAVITLGAALVQMVNWGKLAGAALRGLAEILDEIAPYAVAAAAALALLYAPAIIGGVITLIAWLGRLVAQLGAVAVAFLAANPALAFIAGITAAVAAAVIFRDELAQIFGRDVVADAKRGANLVIGSFVAAYEDIKFVWSNFGTIIGKAIEGAVNAVIKGVNEMVKQAAAGVDTLISTLNKVLPEGAQIAPIGDLGDVVKPWDGGFGDLGGAVDARNKAVQDALSRDYLGEFGEGISRGASAASEKLKDLAKWMETVDEKGKKRSGKTEAEKYDDIINGAERRIASLHAERDALGLTEEAALKLRYEQDLLNQAQARGISLTGSQRLEISNLAEQMASLEYGTEMIREQMDFAKDTTRGVIDGISNAFEDGKITLKEWGDIAVDVFGRVTDYLLNDLLDAFFKVNSAGSGGGGGILGGIMSFLGFGGGGKSAAPSWLDNGFDTSRYAAGTPAARPGLAWVGERGPELVRFKGGEEVIPNHRIISANQNSPSNRSGGATTSDVRVTADVRAYVDDNGNWQAKVENISAGVSQAVVGQYDRDKSNLYQNGNAA